MTPGAPERPTPAALAPIVDLVREEMEAVQEEMDRLCRSRYPRLEEFLRYLARYTGKRIRPVLVFLAGRCCGPLTREHRRLAVTLEALHTATLIHDDIIDRADVRRKLESVNRRFGNERAVLLGDFLFAESFQQAVRLERPEVREKVARLCRDLCVGEILEVCHRFDLDLTEEEYIDIVYKKTGLLFEVGCGIAGELAGGSPEAVEALASYGRHLGMAFQIVDDCLDLVGQETSMGKSLGNDVTHGMTTLPIIQFYRTAPPEVQASFRERFHAPPCAERDRAIQGFLEGSDCVAYAYARAEEWTGEAKRSLARLPASPCRDALGEILGFVIRRIQ